jgi:hypothetical protein
MKRALLYAATSAGIIAGAIAASPLMAGAFLVKH